MTKNEALAVVLLGLIPIYALMFLKEQNKQIELPGDIVSGNSDISSYVGFGWPFTYEVRFQSMVIKNPSVWTTHRQEFSNRYVLNIGTGIMFVAGIAFCACRLVVFLFGNRRLTIMYVLMISCAIAITFAIDLQLKYAANLLSENVLTMTMTGPAAILPSFTYDGVSTIKWIGLYCVAYSIVAMVVGASSKFVDRRRNVEPKEDN